MELMVGIGEYQIGQAEGSIITRGLGSCVGVTLWDPSLRIGGLAHVMLPSSREFSSYSNPFKFADIAIPALYDSLLSKAGRPLSLKAKLAGGAHMFSFKSDRPGFDIGQRNIVKAKEVLHSLFVPICGDDTGGNWGRTMVLDLASGVVQVRTVGKGEKVL